MEQQTFISFINLLIVIAYFPYLSTYTINVYLGPLRLITIIITISRREVVTEFCMCNYEQ